MKQPEDARGGGINAKTCTRTEGLRLLPRVYQTAKVEVIEVT